jgi:hypothetical protein
LEPTPAIKQELNKTKTRTRVEQDPLKTSFFETFATNETIETARLVFASLDGMFVLIDRQKIKTVL